MKFKEVDVPGTERNFGLLAVLSRGTVRIEFMSHMMNMPRYMPPVTHWDFTFIGGMGIVEARNMAAKRAIDKGAKYLAFIDDDTFVPMTMISRFFYIMQNNPKIKLMTGVSFSKANPSFPLIFEEDRKGPISVKRLIDDMGKIIEVGAAGLGCVLIDVEVLKKFKDEKWFNADTFVGLSQYAGKARGGDITFFRKARELGYPLYCDTSCLCDHMDVSNLKFYPITNVKTKLKEAFDKANKEGRIENGFSVDC